MLQNYSFLMWDAQTDNYLNLVYLILEVNFIFISEFLLGIILDY